MNVSAKWYAVDELEMLWDQLTDDGMDSALAGTIARNGYYDNGAYGDELLQRAALHGVGAAVEQSMKRLAEGTDNDPR